MVIRGAEKLRETFPAWGGMRDVPSKYRAEYFPVTLQRQT